MKKIYVLATLLMVLLFTSNVNAFSINPSKTVMTIDPDSKKNISIEISNSDQNETTYTYRVLGVRQKNDGTPEFVSGISIAESWIKFKDSNISLNGGQKGKIDFDIYVPKNAKSGSYYLAIVIRPQVQTENTSAIIGEIVSLLNIQVSGAAHEILVINKWEFDKTKSDNNNWLFNLNLANTGNMDVNMDGTVSVLNWRGNEILKQKIYLGNKFLTNSVRFLQPKVDIEKKIIVPSVYQVKIEIKYGFLNQSITSIGYVIYFPFWSKVVLFLIFTILLILVFGLIKARRRRNK